MISYHSKFDSAQKIKKKKVSKIDSENREG